VEPVKPVLYWVAWVAGLLAYVTSAVYLYHTVEGSVARILLMLLGSFVPAAIVFAILYVIPLYVGSLKSKRKITIRTFW
jgi:hypothetical protein